MRVVRGTETVQLGAAEVASMLAPYRRVVVDVGAGDGRSAYAYARENPDTFVVGLDILKENLAEAARRALRKPQRGGVPNVAYVWAGAEEPPSELAGRCDEVRVVLPWGRLLEGLALGHGDVLAGLATLAAPGAALRVVLNCEVWSRNTPVRVSHLPELTPHYVRETLTPRYRAYGLEVTETRMLSREEVRAIRSPWAKRLRSSRDWPRFLYLAGTAAAG